MRRIQIRIPSNDLSEWTLEWMGHLKIWLEHNIHKMSEAQDHWLVRRSWRLIHREFLTVISHDIPIISSLGDI